MPTLGISSEWVGAREDDIAAICIAQEHLDQLRRLVDELERRHFVTTAYARDARDSLDIIAAGLLMGKRNSARLRNRRIDE